MAACEVVWEFSCSHTMQGSVWKYSIANSTWTDITPVSGGDLYFGFGYENRTLLSWLKLTHPQRCRRRCATSRNNHGGCPKLLVARWADLPLD